MKNLVFGLLVGLVPVTGIAQTITTSAITGGPFCPGSTVNVSYNISGYSPTTDNIFTAELSDASGDFISPTATESITSNTPVAIILTIPTNPEAGTGYKVRVISSDPPATSNIVDLAITVLTASTSKVDVTCFGESTGSITVNASGGTSEYTFVLSGTATATQTQTSGDYTFTGLAFGTYNIDVKVANNCSITQITGINITQSTVLTASASDTDVTCNGANDGVINITSASGGYGTYQYSIDGSNWQSSGDFTALEPATYPVYIRDAAQTSCEITLGDAIIEQPNVMTATVADTDVTCNDANDGVINITSASGGYGTYQYSIDGSNWQSSGDFTTLEPATYPVYIRDATRTSCVIALSDAIIDQPNIMTATVADTDVTCNDANDGIINITGATGGSNSFEYSINGGSNWQTSGDFTALEPATYPVSIRDAAQTSCEITLGDVIIEQPNLLTISESHLEIKCKGDNTGSIDITVAGGTSPYTYSWGSGEDTQDLFNLLAGDYNLTVSDANACTTTTSVIITQPAAVLGISITKASYNGSDVSCAGASDGAINIIASGGTPNYTFKLNGGSIITQSGTNHSYEDLADGTYTIDLADANGCVITTQTIILSDPAPVDATSTITNVSCHDGNNGIIMITPSGGTGTLTYAWTTLDGSGLNATSQDQTGLTDGIYSLIISDANGCTFNGNYEITEPDKLVIAETHNNVVCYDDAGPSNDGDIDIGVQGGTGAYTYNWSNGATTQDIYGLVAGSYTVTVTDAVNCSAAITISIANPTQLVMTVTDPDPVCQPITVDITQIFTDNFNGAPTYWLNSSLTDELLNPTAVTVSGVYYISQTTAEGCRVTRPVDVVVYDTPDLITTTLDALCNESSVELTTIYVDQNNTDGLVTYWYDDAATQEILDPTDIRTSGTYYIKKTTVNGCIDIEQFDVAITLLPILNITNPDPVCQPYTVDITNSFVDENNTSGTVTFWLDEITTTPIPDPTAIPASGTYYLQKTTFDGCTSTVPVEVVVYILPDLTTTNPTPICVGDIVDLSTTYVEHHGLAGIMTYWTDKVLTISVEDPNNVKDAGRYYLLFTSDDGCIDSDSVDVLVGAYPDLVVTTPGAVCEGTLVDITLAVIDQLEVPATFTYWQDAEFTDPLMDGLASVTGTYYAKKTSAYGCVSSTPVNVLVNKIPTLVVSGVTGICSPGTINLENTVEDTNSSTGQLTYWQDEALTLPLSNPQAIGTSGTYYVKKQTIFGACMDAIGVDITIQPIPDPAIITLVNDTLRSNIETANQWYDDNGAIAGAMESYLVPELIGLYFVNYTLNMCESPLSEGFLYTPTGIELYNPVIDYTLYPNPADKSFVITLEGYNGEAKVIIRDLRGVTVIEKSQYVSGQNNKIEIDVSGRKNGPYFVNIITGNKHQVEKLILK